jgi:hypothetical protein
MGMSVGFDHGFQKKNEFLGEVHYHHPRLPMPEGLTF